MSKVNLECICGNDNKFVVIGALRFCEVCGLNQIEIEKHSENETTEKKATHKNLFSCNTIKKEVRK